jgi:hypothetical protein
LQTPRNLLTSPWGYMYPRLRIAGLAGFNESIIVFIMTKFECTSVVDNDTLILWHLLTIHAHGLKIQGRGYLMFFAKIPREGQGFQEKLRGGWGSSYFGFYCIFINKCFEICLRGLLYLPSTLTPTSSPPHVHLCC